MTEPADHFRSLKIFRLILRADFDFRVFGHGIGTAFDPFHSLFDWLIKQKWQSWNSCQTQSYGAIGTYLHIFDILQRPTRISDDAMYRESR